MRCIAGWHRSEAVCFAHDGTNSAVHNVRFMEISYILFKFRTNHMIHRNCPYTMYNTLMNSYTAKMSLGQMTEFGEVFQLNYYI